MPEEMTPRQVSLSSHSVSEILFNVLTFLLFIFYLEAHLFLEYGKQFLLFQTTALVLN